jgi:hypothetical protein
LWKWFIANELQIIDSAQNESVSDHIIDNIDNLILDIGMFTWEIGQGKIKPWFLTISPNGDRELIKISTEIIEHAPNLDNWEFNYCKPAIDWDRKFIIYDSILNEQHIDASKWKYVALQHEEGMIELILEATNIAHLDRETARTAADLFVTSEIGEEAKIQKVFSVDIVNQIDNQDKSRMARIQDLKKHLNEL